MSVIDCIFWVATASASLNCFISISFLCFAVNSSWKLSLGWLSCASLSLLWTSDIFCSTWKKITSDFNFWCLIPNDKNETLLVRFLVSTGVENDLRGGCKTEGSKISSISSIKLLSLEKSIWPSDFLFPLFWYHAPETLILESSSEIMLSLEAQYDKLSLLTLTSSLLILISSSDNSKLFSRSFNTASTLAE